VPSPEGSRSLRDLFAALGLRLRPAPAPKEQVSQMYRFLKEQQHDSRAGGVVLIRQGDALYAFGDDAHALARTCGDDVLVQEKFKGLPGPTARVSVADQQRCVNALLHSGREVTVADPDRWRPLTIHRSSERPSAAPAAERLPRLAAKRRFALFACPACGYKSTYDPWVESARCPNCGYTPSAPATKPTTDVLTLFCPGCKLSIPYNLSDPQTSCPWCGFALPLFSANGLSAARQVQQAQDAAHNASLQATPDRQRLAIFMGRLLLWCALAIVAVVALYLLFAPAIPLLFGLGLVLLVVGLRNLKTRKGTVSFQYVLSAPAQTFDVQGGAAVLLGLLRVLLGLGLVLFSSLPRVAELWAHLQRIFSWLPSNS
jgi:hypothetical protein